MRLSLHHVNFATERVGEMKTFYEDVLGMGEEPELNTARKTDEGYAGGVAFMSDGNLQVHIAERDLNVGFNTGKGVNPLDRGHLAFRTDDIAAFKARLDERKVPYADFGDWAMEGWQQIFFYDPDGNVIEVHQVADGAVGA
ncbi:MAG: VOC family protein [Pseudomonadota bacterium]